MLIDFSLLNGTRKLIECDPNEKITNIIPKIVSAFQLERFKTIRLIYKGRRIDENEEIKNLGYTQGQVVIVNAQGEKPAELPSSQPDTSSSDVPAAQPPARPTETPSSTTQQPERPPPENNVQNLPTEQISITQRRPPVPLPDPEKWEENLRFMIDMGFSENLSIRALVQAYNQPERAVELIYSDQVKEQELPSTTPSPPPPIVSPPSPPDSQSQTPPTTQPNISREDQSSQHNTYSSRVNQFLRQLNTLDNTQNQDLPQNLPNPQSHPLPDVPVQFHQENRNDRLLLPEASSTQILADSPPTDPTVEPDHEFDIIRQLIIDDPKYIDNIIDIIQENNGEDEAFAEQMRANPKLLMHLFGIRKTEICNVPDNYSNDDIAAIRRLYGLGEFTWEQIIDAYENSERNEDFAEAFLLSLNVYD